MTSISGCHGNICLDGASCPTQRQADAGLFRRRSNLFQKPGESAPQLVARNGGKDAFNALVINHIPNRRAKIRLKMKSTSKANHGRIDAHHHLWRYAAHEFPWITENMAVLQRDFLMEDLAVVARENQISGTIVVQARQSLEETQWLSELAAGSELICAVVGWAPLADAGVLPILESVAALPKLKGLRHILQDEADEAYVLREDFNRGISHLKNLNLVYELLVFERQLPDVIEFVDRHPNQVFLLDHIGKPQIRSRMLEPWRSNIRKLAQRENVYCKVSGMVTEADWTARSIDDLQTYFDVVLEAFGTDRIMFGSDWPVLTLAAPYSSWVSCAESAVARLSHEEQKKFWRANAINVYKLEVQQT